MSARYRLTFKGADGLPYGTSIQATSDREAISEAHRLYDTTSWVLRRWTRTGGLVIVAEHTLGVAA